MGWWQGLSVMVPLEVSEPVTAAVSQRCVRVGRAMAALTGHGQDHRAQPSYQMYKQ